MSALRPNHGSNPDPIDATMPVLATGHLYSIPSESSSDLTNSLVFTSSKASSGYSCIRLLILFNHSKNSGSLAEFNNSRVSELSCSDPVRVGVAIAYRSVAWYITSVDAMIRIQRKDMIDWHRTKRLGDASLVFNSCGVWCLEVKSLTFAIWPI